MKYRRRTGPRTEPTNGGVHLLVKPQAAVLVGAVFPGEDRPVVEEHLEELARLTLSAGARVVGRTVQERRRADAAYFIGRGKAAEVEALVRESGADLVIFDDDLSPAQVRNLSELLQVQVVDRSGLILDIFARRARSREAKTQVELARLKYLLPRLRGGWTHLSRQEGGIGVRGGIGETQIELDRRLLRRRIHRLAQELARIEKERRQRRHAREEAFKIALVGYTNAGKTTLFNALTSNRAVVEDRLFTTLDPLVRRLHLRRSREILLIDTVGFIRKLPHHLVASFRSTLEEAAEADLLLHVADVSHPDYEEQMETTRRVLISLEMQDRPVLPVFNKVDRVEDPAVTERALRLHPDGVLVSASGGTGLEGVLERVDDLLQQEIVEEHLRLRSSDSESISRVYALAEVIRADYNDGFVDIRFRTSRTRARAIQAGAAVREAG